MRFAVGGGFHSRIRRSRAGLVEGDRPAGRSRRARKRQQRDVEAMEIVGRISPWLVAAMVAVILTAVGMYALWPESEGSGPKLNVLLITIDTLRADHLGCYGYEKIKTPHIDRLASEGTKFAECSTAVPITLPSHASIMTATYPYVQGTRVNDERALHESNLTLAEIFKKSGCSTHAEIAAFVLNARFGLHQGFDSYHDVGPPVPEAVAAGRDERAADEVCESTIDWLRAHASERFFVWAHFFDPHFPYTPPQRYRDKYEHPYDGEIAFVDEQIGRLVDALDQLEIASQTLVVFTSDHGEGLWEHGEELHTVFIYDSTLSVPLIFRCPGRVPPGRVVKAQVRTIDIAPTILDLVDLPPKPDAQGISLRPLISGEGEELELAAYGESLEPMVRFGYSALRCLRVGGWKYIHAPQPELYHVAEDPGEARNVARQYPDRIRSMRDRLRQLIADAPAPPGTGQAGSALDAESARRLRSVGYLTGGGSRNRTAATQNELVIFEPQGPDPKDRVEAIRWMHESTKGLRTGDLDAAIAAYRKALQADPDLAAAQYRLGQALHAQGKSDDALKHYREALRLDPELADAHCAVGGILVSKGRHKDAVQHLQRAIELQPDLANAHMNMGFALAATGKLDEAILHHARAVRIDPKDASLRMSLAETLFARGRRDEAATEYREVLRLDPGNRLARMRLDALSGAGR